MQEGTDVRFLEPAGAAGSQRPVGSSGHSRAFRQPRASGGRGTIGRLRRARGWDDGASSRKSHGGYFVTGATELGNNAVTEGFVDCTLSDGASTSSGSAFLANKAAFLQTLTLTGSTSGGVITLSCTPDNAGQARNGVITAVRVGALHTG